MEIRFCYGVEMICYNDNFKAKELKGVHSGSLTDEFLLKEVEGSEGIVCGSSVFNGGRCELKLGYEVCALSWLFSHVESKAVN